MKISFKLKENMSIGYIFELFFALSLVLNCRSIWLYLSLTEGFFKHVVLAMLVVSTIGIIIVNGKLSKLSIQKLIFTITVFIGYSGVLLLLTDSDIKLYLQLFISIIFIILFYFFAGNKSAVSILKKYEDIVLLIAVISLFFWILGSVLHIVSATGTVDSIWSGSPVPANNYYWLYYETQIDEAFESNICRNTAIFSEAPMASLNFSIAFLTEFFLVPKPSKLRLLILIAAIISTISFTGYILVIISIGAKYILNSPKSNVMKFLKIFGVIIVVTIVAIIGNTLISKKIETSSGAVRIEDFIVGFKAWLTSPIIGHGFGNMDSAVALMRGWRIATKKTGVSNSITVILTQGGICMMLLYAYPVIKSIRSAIKQKDKDMLLFTCVLMYMFIVTSCAYLYIIVFLLICFAENNFTTEKREEIIKWLKRNR